MLDKKFDVIYADPPWSYSEVPYFKKSLAIQYKYPTLKQKDLLKINVERIAKDNAWLFLWAVWAQLPHAINLIEAWGFTYRTCAFVWAKKTKNGKNAKTYGRCCTQGSTEIVLVGKRGRPKRYAQNVEQLLEARTRGNSVKPDEIYDRIDLIVDPTKQEPNLKPIYCSAESIDQCPTYSDGCWCHVQNCEPVTKIELFARQQWKDWYALGNDEKLNQPNNKLCLYGDIRDIIGVKNGI